MILIYKTIIDEQFQIDITRILRKRSFDKNLDIISFLCYHKHRKSPLYYAEN